jgi:hypothetical protein
LTLNDVNGDSWDPGPVQLLNLTINPMLPCVPTASPNDPLSVTTGYVVVGAARAPVERKATFLGLLGPRSSQVWPLAGAFLDR